MLTGTEHPETGNLQDEDRLSAIWNIAYNAKTKNDLLNLYKTWACNYDEDHNSVGFFGHYRAARLLAKYITYPEVANILDAGAGTGAAGEALVELGFKNITALDFSSEMLDIAAKKGVYRDLIKGDLSEPLDCFPCAHFDAAILVGVYSYGQAPAHSLEELVRVVRPGGLIVFTMRTDFFEEDAMGVRSQIAALETAGAWQQVEYTEPAQYLPQKDPDALFRVWCYRVHEAVKPEPLFSEEISRALLSKDKVKRIDHCHIWDSVGSRLYDKYAEYPGYYLAHSELEIIQESAEQLAGENNLIIELGCGSARKIRHIIQACLERNKKNNTDEQLTYVPIDISPGAVESTQKELEAEFADHELPLTIQPSLGSFNDVLPTLPSQMSKAMFFFGGSIGNIESLEKTVQFLSSIKNCMTERDRLVVGLDLDKDVSIFKQAYEAGQEDFKFFLNMIRRINKQLGANFNLKNFDQESTYDQSDSYKGIVNRCVNLKLIAKKTQIVYLSRLNIQVVLEKGEAIQVGVSRKFRPQDIPLLFELAGMRLNRQWLDNREYFALNECMKLPEDS